jgi:hypothetical protein
MLVYQRDLYWVSQCVPEFMLVLVTASFRWWFPWADHQVSAKFVAKKGRKPEWYALDSCILYLCNIHIRIYVYWSIPMKIPVQLAPLGLGRGTYGSYPILHLSLIDPKWSKFSCDTATGVCRPLRIAQLGVQPVRRVVTGASPIHLSIVWLCEFDWIHIVEPVTYQYW